LLLVTAGCPQWGPGTAGQGVTAKERASAPPNVFSELSAAEYNAGEQTACIKAVDTGSLLVLLGMMLAIKMM